MIEQIIESLRDDLSEKFTEEFGIPQTEVDPALTLAQKNILSAIKYEVSQGNLNGLFSLLQETGKSTSNPVITQMIQKYAEDLLAETGIEAELADQVASFTIPFIIHKFQDMSKENGLDLTALMSMLNLPNAGKNDETKG